MPIILDITFEHSTKMNDKINVQIWRHNEKNVSKSYVFGKKLKSVQLDPMRETADIDTSNNTWLADTATEASSKFSVFKAKQGANVRGAGSGNVNPMQAAEKKK